MPRSPPASPQDVDRDRADDHEWRKCRRAPAAAGEHLVTEKRDHRVRKRGPARGPAARKGHRRDPERRRDEGRDEHRVEEAFARDRRDVVKVQREDADRAQVTEREEAQETPDPVVDREHAGSGCRKPTKEADAASRDAAPRDDTARVLSAEQLRIRQRDDGQRDRS